MLILKELSIGEESFTPSDVERALRSSAIASKSTASGKPKSESKMHGKRKRWFTPRFFTKARRFLLTAGLRFSVEHFSFCNLRNGILWWSRMWNACSHWPKHQLSFPTCAPVTITAWARMHHACVFQEDQCTSCSQKNNRQRVWCAVISFVTNASHDLVHLLLYIGFGAAYVGEKNKVGPQILQSAYCTQVIKDDINWSLELISLVLVMV